MNTKFLSVLLAPVLGAIALLSPLAVHAEQGQDHYLVSRYAGSKIDSYDYKEFEEAQILLSKPYLRNGEWVADKVLPLEGKVTYIHYEVPASASAFQVFRNYQLALAKSGFKELFVCNRPCTNANLSSFKTLLKARNLYLNYTNDNQYIAAQSGNAYVSMFVNDGGVWLFVIEKEAMATDKVSVVGTSAIAQALSKEGRVDVYGLTFDTGKSTLKPASKSTLIDLAKVLKDNPDMALDVIGHTDNVGSPDANLKLSKDRSEAVVAALISDYGIQPNRLNPSGMGQNHPIDNNDSEKGKAANRRVEFKIQTQSKTADAQPVRREERVVRTAPTRSEEPSVQQQPQPQQPATTAPSVNVEKAIDMAKKLRSLF